jgi:hypothetical protein
MFRGIRKILIGGEREREILDLVREHIGILDEAAETLRIAIESDNPSLNYEICELERTGDVVRREIALKLYEGAFLPAIRAEFYRFSELVDESIDLIEDTSVYFNMLSTIPAEIRDLCHRIARLNCRMIEYLLKAFDALEGEGDLTDKIIRIRSKEQEIDGLKREIHSKILHIDIKSFWEGYILSNFLDNLVNISDKVEDAADVIQILHASLR